MKFYFTYINTDALDLGSPMVQLFPMTLLEM